MKATSSRQQAAGKIKKISFFLVACCLLPVACCLPAEAAWVTQNARGTPLKKFGRGVVNVVTGVLELPREMYMAGQEAIQQGEYPFTAYPIGVLKGAIPGVVKTVERVGSGAYDIVSFPVEQPANYGSLYQPATIFAPGNWTAPKRQGSAP